MQTDEAAVFSGVTVTTSFSGEPVTTSVSWPIQGQKVVIPIQLSGAMNRHETFGWMGVTFGALPAFIIVAELTFAVVSTTHGPARPAAALYLVVAIGCYAVGSGLILRAQDGST